MTLFHDHTFPVLERIDSPEGRVYATPTGAKYPSVTAVTGVHSGKHLEQWRARVGHEEAAKVSSRASKRGTAIHSLCEDYIRGGSAKPSMFDYDTFMQMVPHLNLVDNVHCLETQMFSHKLQVAGTTDCIAEYNGKLSVIDFKTSLKLKRKEWISNYFMQCAAYAFMFWEHTQLLPEQSVVMIAVDDEDTQVFVEPIKNWLNQFISLREEFRQIKGY